MIRGARRAAIVLIAALILFAIARLGFSPGTPPAAGAAEKTPLERAAEARAAGRAGRRPAVAAVSARAGDRVRLRTEWSVQDITAAADGIDFKERTESLVQKAGGTVTLTLAEVRGDLWIVDATIAADHDLAIFNAAEIRFSWSANDAFEFVKGRAGKFSPIEALFVEIGALLPHRGAFAPEPDWTAPLAATAAAMKKLDVRIEGRARPRIGFDERIGRPDPPAFLYTADRYDRHVAVGPRWAGSFERETLATLAAPGTAPLELSGEIQVREAVRLAREESLSAAAAFTFKIRQTASP